MSSLKDHFERTRAQKHTQMTAAAAAIMAATAGVPTASHQDSPQDSPQGNIELKFFNDYEQIKSLQSKTTRNERKAAALPEYTPYIEGVLASGVSPQNDMLLILMVWALDTQALALATDIAQFALLNNMTMPEPFSRDVATVFAEQFADEIIKNDAKADDGLVKKAIDVVTDSDMPDEVRAKLYRAYGLVVALHSKADAISAYEMALKLDPQVGCKTDLARLKKDELQKDEQQKDEQ